MVTSKTRWVETATATKKSAINSKILTATWLAAELYTKQQTNATAKYYNDRASCSILETRGFKNKTSDIHSTPDQPVKCLF